MDATPPFPVVSSQRQLAVIMFTDAVGFSAKMHEQELATLNRIERDREVMQRIFDSHSGTVLKSTGDGQLVQFVSAVQAVACALDIQRHFVGRTDPTYALSALRYRISIHLGDVFVGNGDVMGDGVNITARLVALAAPNGIVISDTVYEVVKNKLPLHVQRAGPQRLKNIKESITMYRVLLDEPSTPTPVAPATTAAASTQPSSAAAPRSRKTTVVLLLALVVGLGLGAKFLLQQRAAHEEDMTLSQSKRAALGAELKKSSAEPDAQAAARAKAYDFAAMVTRTPALENPSPETAGPRLSAEVRKDTLIVWLLSTGLVRYTKDRPLYLNNLGDPSLSRTAVFLDAGRQLNFIEGGASRRREWPDLKPAVQGAIIVSVLLDASLTVPPEVREGAAAFAYLHGRPEMIEGLKR